MTINATTHPDLFRDYRYGKHRPSEQIDVCAGKHHGNANSEAAFKTGNKENDERVIFELITSSSDGITIHEACSALNKHPNQISGRFTSLKLKGLVYVNGKRNGAGVHYAKV